MVGNSVGLGAKRLLAALSGRGVRMLDAEGLVAVKVN